MVTNRELIEAALDSLHPLRRDDGVKFGNVSAAVASSSGRIYQGDNLFTPACAAKICAEKMAFGAMATAGEYEAAKVVAVWRPEAVTTPMWCLHAVGAASSSASSRLWGTRRSSSSARRTACPSATYCPETCRPDRSSRPDVEGSR